MVKTLLATLTAAGLVGCVIDSPDLGTTQGQTFEEFKAQLQREPGTGGYVLDWDIVIHDEVQLYDHWASYQQGSLSIHRVNGADVKWNDTQKLNLSYCVGNGFGATNKQKIIDAMSAATVGGWEKFANIKFVYVPAQDANCTATNTNVVFDVNLAPPGSPYLARAFFPNSPRNERNVLVEAASFDPAATGNITLTNIIIHELGHALGFRHEHIARPGQATAGCVEDQNYRLLTAYDQVSTMHYPQCGSPNNTLALSAMDQTGIAAVYGAPIVNTKPMATVMRPTPNATVPPSFEVVGSVVDTNLAKAELYVDGAVYGAALTTAPWVFQVTNLSAGQHTLKILATDQAGLTAEEEVVVTVSASAGPAGTGVESDDVTGGCSTSHGSGGLAVLGLVGLLLRRRRR